MDETNKEIIKNIINNLTNVSINISVDNYNKIIEGIIDEQSIYCLLPIFTILNNSFSNNMLFSKEEFSNLINLYNIFMYG